MQRLSSSIPLPPYNIHHAPYSATTTTAILPDDSALYDPSIYEQALALLQQSEGLSNASSISESNPDKPVHFSTHAPQIARQDSAIATAGVPTHHWQTSMHQAQSYNSMNGSVAQQQHRGIKRSRSHQRTPSASTVASNDPASPYIHSDSYPFIATTDTSPEQTPFYADQAFFSKNLPTPSQTPTDSAFAVASVPSQSAHMSDAHYAMKGFGIDHHTDDYLSDLAPSRQSMSSYGNDSPATPHSGNGDIDTKQYNVPQNDYRPNVQLFRTESQAYQDEMYNPNTVYTSAPAKTSNSNSYLSPHRNLITERLQTANMARSASPASAVSRERSPFRANSPLIGPVDDWKQQSGIPTAQALRQQQQQEAAQKEVQRATLRREPTKTISPKDALLDYTAEGDAPLFSDNIPEGYERHFGGTEQWPTNNYLSQTTNFSDLAGTGQQSMTFRNATPADNGYSGPTFDFSSTGLPQGSDPNKNNPFATNYQAAVAAQMNQYTEPTPDFPASIPSMETSHSDAGLPASSQETNANGPTSIPERPDDTRANTGTYTCTYHGCSQRFHSHNDLQKHKREYHRSQQQIKADTTSPSATGSTSPRSSESPGPSTAGMTSAQILARNSQAGPHKCTRINPSTNKPCNTVFSRPYDLTRHEDTIHNGRKQKVRCPMCQEEKTFSRNDALTRHMRVVHPEVESFGKRGRRGD